MSVWSSQQPDVTENPGFKIQGRSWEIPGAQGDQVCECSSEDGLTQVLLTLRAPLKQANEQVKHGKSTLNSVLTLLTCDQLLKNPFVITDWCKIYQKKDKRTIVRSLNYQIILFSLELFHLCDEGCHIPLKLGSPSLFSLFRSYILHFTFFPFLSSELPLIALLLSWKWRFSNRIQYSNLTIYSRVT